MSKSRNYKMIDDYTYEFSRGGGAHGPKFVVRLERSPTYPHSDFVEYGVMLLDKTIRETAYMREIASTKSSKVYDLTKYVDDYTSAETSAATSPTASPPFPFPSKKLGLGLPERRCRSRSASVSDLPKSMIKILKVTTHTTFIFCGFVALFCGMIYLFLNFSENAIDGIVSKRLKIGAQRSMGLLGNQ